MLLTTKFELGQEVYYVEDKFTYKKGEILEIIFDGTFNNIPKYIIGYNGNIWAEDDLCETEAEAIKKQERLRDGI